MSHRIKEFSLGKELWHRGHMIMGLEESFGDSCLGRFEGLGLTGAMVDSHKI